MTDFIILTFVQTLILFIYDKKIKKAGYDNI